MAEDYTNQSASEFLKEEDSSNQSAKAFLEGPVDEEDYSKQSASAFLNEGTPAKIPWWQKTLDVVTGGHIGGFTDAPEKEVSFTPEGKMTKNLPESAELGFFEDPVTAAAFSAVMGVTRGASVAKKVVEGLKEAAGWATGGVTDIVPALGKAGLKSSVKALSAKPMEQTLKAAQKTPMGIKPGGVSMPKVGTGPAAGVGRGVEALGEGFKHPLPTTPTTAKAVAGELPRRSDLIKTMADAFGVPIDTGRNKMLSSGKALGIYKVDPRVIRLKHPNDVRVAAHEVGHHIQNLLGFPKEMPSSVRSMAYPGADNLDREGFAEFIRYYIESPKTAQRMSGNEWFNAFEKSLDEHKDVKEIFESLQKGWSDWRNLSPTDKMKSYIRYGDEMTKEGKTVKKTFDSLYTKIVDSFRPLKKLEQTVENLTGTTIKEINSPYLQAQLTRGWTGKAEQLLKGSGRLEAGEVVGKSLRDIVKQVDGVGGSVKDLDAYLYAKRATSDPRIIRAFESSSQMSVADFFTAVKKGDPKYANIADELYKYQDGILEDLVKSGRISGASADTMKQRNLFYAPLYKVMGDQIGGVGSKSIANLPEPIKGLKGSTRDTWSPIENMIYNTYYFTNLAEKNKVGVAIADLSMKTKGLGGIIERVGRKMKPVNITKKEIMGKGFVEEEDVLDDMMTFFRPSKALDPNEVVFYRNGKPEHYIVRDKDLFAALTSLDEKNIIQIPKILQYPAKWLRTGATTSLEFLLRNPVRDQVSAFVFSKYGYVPGYDFVKGALHVLKKDKMYQLFNSSGAAHAALVSMDRNYLSKGLKELMRSDRGISNLYKQSPLKNLQKISELFEEATRVGAFAKALRKETPLGMALGTDKRAMMLAALEGRDMTLDFQAFGSNPMMKAYNSITAFFNARIRGLDKMGRAFKERPFSTSAKAAGGITLPTVLLWAHNKDDPYYQELPAWRKTLAWNFIFHNRDGSLKTIISIPRPFELGILFGGMPEAALNWAYKNDKRGMKVATETFLKELVPLSAPTFAVAPSENWDNKSRFFDRPIVSRGKERLTGKNTYLQYGPNTTESAKLIGKGMSKIPGLREFASPAKIQNLVRGWTGGLGYMTLEAADKALESLDIINPPIKPTMALADVPGLRAFAVRFPSANTASIEEFYEKLKIAESDYAAKDAEKPLAEKNLNKMLLQAVNKQMPRGIKLGGPPGKLKKLRDTAEILSKHRDYITIFNESRNLDATEKRAKLNLQYLLMINTARRGVGKPIIPIPGAK
ncbi:hypothetical protein LCGC14_1045640 [marine sediment metagenome]|uniref:Large polyvalent protein associated domain-containing protein n=1 Tax=marine sediment metagenome TaxID=412755 RepID=A0A0F9NC59_9ZZZZ